MIALKKTLAALAVLVLLLSTGCNASPAVPTAPPTAPENFESTVTAAFDTLEITAVLTKEPSSYYTLDILTPEILEPLTLRYSDGNCSVEYDTLSFEANLARFPQTEFGAFLTDALACVYDGIDIGTSYSDGIWKYTGTVNGSIFTLTQSADSGEWLEFTLNDKLIHVVFSDFRIL